MKTDAERRTTKKTEDVTYVGIALTKYDVTQENKTVDAGVTQVLIPLFVFYCIRYWKVCVVTVTIIIHVRNATLYHEKR